MSPPESFRVLTVCVGNDARERPHRTTEPADSGAARLLALVRAPVVLIGAGAVSV